jgi:H+-transporting ATPase
MLNSLPNTKAIVTRITAIEFAGMTILCSDKTGTLTTNKLTIGISFTEDVILLAAYTSRTEKLDAIDSAVVQEFSDAARVRAGIKLLDFKP